MARTGFTPFSIIYDSFYARVSDVMYMEITEFETFQMLQDLLVNAIPRFEFPRFDIFDYELGYVDEQTYSGVLSGGSVVPCTVWVGGFFNAELTAEEVNILSLAMVIEWIGQQITTSEHSRMKFSGSDFKFTSQANHLAKLKNLKDNYDTDLFGLQRLYKRRKFENGRVFSTMGSIMATPDYGLNISTRN